MKLHFDIKIIFSAYKMQMQMCDGIKNGATDEQYRLINIKDLSLLSGNQHNHRPQTEYTLYYKCN